MLILFLFILYCAAADSMDINHLNADNKSTCRVYVNSYPNILHYSVYNTKAITTWIFTPHVCVIKKTVCAWTVQLTSYEVWRYGQKLDTLDGTAVFKELKEQYRLAEEPTFESLYPTQTL